MHFATQFQGVLSHSVGDVIDELGHRIGPLKFRPFEAAQTGKKVAAETDSWKAPGELAADARIESIGGGRRVESPGRVGW